VEGADEDTLDMERESVCVRERERASERVSEKERERERERERDLFGIFHNGGSRASDLDCFIVTIVCLFCLRV